MTGSPRERQERIDALLDVVAENRRASIPQLTALAVRSWLINAKTAREYVDLLLQAGWVDLEGFDYIINAEGRRHLRNIDDWPDDTEKKVLKTRSQKARESQLPPPAAVSPPTPAPEAPPSPPSPQQGGEVDQHAGEQQA